MLKLILVFLVSTALLLYFLTRRKTKTPIEHLKENGAMQGIIFAFVFAIVGVVVLYASSASAETKYLHYTSVFAGLDVDANNKTFCHGGDINDRLTSNLGVRQGLIKAGQAEVYAQYTHHSCALNRDKPTYDAVGIGFEYRVDW